MALAPSLGCTQRVHHKWRGEGYPSDLSLRLNGATTSEVGLDCTLLHEQDELRSFPLRFDPALDDCSSVRVVVVPGGRLRPGEPLRVPIEASALRSGNPGMPQCEVELEYTPLEGRGGVALFASTEAGRRLSAELDSPHRHRWLLAYPLAAVADVVLAAGIVVVLVPYGLCRAASTRCMGWIHGKTTSP